MVLSIIGIIAAMALVFFLAWFVTRVVALNGSFNGKGRYFTILEKFPVTKESYIMLVKSFDKLLLVGATAGRMTVLKEFDLSDVDLDEYQPGKQSFADIFKTTLDGTLPEGRVKDAFNKFVNKKKGGDEDE
jgi:flagellar protein FliO/FliZ